MSFANELGDRYVAVWNERDPERRREMVAERLREVVKFR